MSAPLLRVREIDAFIEQFHILEDVTFDVPDGGITVLLGRNGAGKTTTLRSVLGMTSVTSGDIEYNGQSIVGKKTHTIAQMGIGYVPEHRAIFSELTVQENLRIAARHKDDLPRNIEMIFTLFPDLKRLYQLQGGNLSGGQQQMLAIARALVPDNRLLLIDEPSEGLAPVIIEQVIAAIKALAETKTVLLVEQNFRVASQLADNYVIMDHGQSVAHGVMASLSQDDEIVQRYLGVGMH
ncbi:MAG: ABC transporter ATP-binding protein [Anaerolineaceae bacterium]|nr:MAG: ABC transporter ATP-binding protein [Anaerolineaceae bacterium]